MQNWAKIWAPIIVGAGMAIVCTVMTLLFPDASIWILLFFLFCGVSLIFIGLYVLLHEFIYKYCEKKELHRLLIITLIIGFVFGVAITHLFYNRNSNVKDVAKTPKQIESDVRNWLEEYGYKVNKVPDEKDHFHFGVESKSGKQSAIKLSKLEDTFIIINVEMFPTGNERGDIDKWSSKKLNDTLIKIKSSLANIGLIYDVHPQLKWVKFNKVLFVESLTKTDLFDACNKLNTGQAMVATFFHESFMVIP